MSSFLAEIIAPRFPRALVTLEVLALAELCRTAAAELGALAENAHRYEHGTLRRRAHAVVRGLHVAVRERVAL